MKMKAIVLEGINQPLTLKEVEIPTPQAGEALIKIKAAAFNRRDWWIQRGQYAGLQFPIILGSDGSGIVESVGEGVAESWIGKEVIINPALFWGENNAYFQKEFKILGLPLDGTFAEYVSVPFTNLHEKPAHLTFEEAAAIPLAGLTAYRALFTKGQCKAGDKVLVTGAGGGAASFALQFAVHAGAEVYVTSSSHEKIDEAKKQGAKGGVNYKDEDWDKQLKEQAQAFDVIIDSALGEGFAKLITLAANGGRIAFFGGTAGDIPAFNGRPVFWKQISLLGTTMGSPQDFTDMISFVNKHQMKPLLDEVFPLEEADTALHRMDTGTSKFGKTVLSIS